MSIDNYECIETVCKWLHLMVDLLIFAKKKLFVPMVLVAANLRAHSPKALLKKNKHSVMSAFIMIIS